MSPRASPPGPGPEVASSYIVKPERGSMSKRKAPVVNNITYNINNYFSRLTGPAPEPGPSNEPPNLFPNDERRNFKYVSRVVSLVTYAPFLGGVHIAQYERPVPF